MVISFTGDIVFNGIFNSKETQLGIFDQRVIQFLSSSDSCVCDIEGPVCTGKRITNKVAHQNSPSIVQFTEAIKGSIWFIGNNHIFDYGTDGLNETIRVAEDADYRVFGAGNNIDEAACVVEIGSECALIGMRYNNLHHRATENTPGCFIWDDEERIKSAIEYAKKKCRWCIVVVHAGREFCNMPFPEDRERYHRILGFGADIIVAHHPHVVQNYETVGSKIIFYSLGNFVFGTDFKKIHNKSDIGVLLKIQLGEDEFSWDYLPIQCDLDSGRINTAERPKVFQNISAEKYESLWPVAIRQYLYGEEIRNIIFNLKRTDISLKSRLRIVGSHIKWFIKLRQSVRMSISQGKNLELEKLLDE